MEAVRLGASTSFPPPLFGHLFSGDIKAIDSPKEFEGRTQISDAVGNSHKY
jgi:hypothetical protein